MGSINEKNRGKKSRDTAPLSWKKLQKPWVHCDNCCDNLTPFACYNKLLDVTLPPTINFRVEEIDTILTYFELAVSNFFFLYSISKGKKVEKL